MIYSNNDTYLKIKKKIKLHKYNLNEQVVKSKILITITGLLNANLSLKIMGSHFYWCAQDIRVMKQF